MSTVSLLDIVQPELERVEIMLQDVARVDYPILATILRDIMGSGGKRLRPALVFLAGALGPSDPLAVAKIAAAVEMTHTATLVHDDLVDNSLLRRGNPTVNAIWHGGIVVLVGDYIFAKAAELASDTGVSDIAKIFGQTLAIISEGELRQAFTARSWQHTEEEYYRRIYAKTASLFAAASESGAILSGHVGEPRARLRRYGHDLGMAFQIVDDILDFVGSERELGKPVASDLGQGLVTLPAIYYMQEHPEDAEFRALAEGGPVTPEIIAAAVAAIRGSSAIERSYDTARAFVASAKEALAPFADNQYRRTMIGLADYAVERMH